MQIWQNILSIEIPNGELSEMWLDCVKEVVKQRVNQVWLLIADIIQNTLFVVHILSLSVVSLRWLFRLLL